MSSRPGRGPRKGQVDKTVIGDPLPPPVPESEGATRTQTMTGPNEGAAVTMAYGGGASGLDNHSVSETIAAGGTDVAALIPGEKIGNYRIEHQVGAGGMGQVFAARRLVGSAGETIDEDSGDWFALKYLEQTSAALLYRFKQEFRTLADVRHENLVSLGELVILDHATFFTMELVDGVPFDEYVRGRVPEGELPNLARLRRAVRQLVAGVRHLHQNDCIHRDLKPSNVLVTTEGRVAILDFGLVQDHSEARTDDIDNQIMGTPAYMSPEQAGLERAMPAADWYAVGVMLYECLTGVRPFEGTVTHLLFAKREFDAPDITTVVPDVPPDLAALCRRLLARNPNERPGAREILAILDGRTDTGAGSLEFDDDSMVRGRVPFIGRSMELSVLREAYAQIVGPGRTQVSVHVRGPSGFGKSALVREFVGRLETQEQPLILKGRCLERESVPYKGIDPVVDALSVYLRQIPGEMLESLRPTYPAALVRLFPVLDDLWRIDRTRVYGVDVHELRQRAFGALRALLVEIARRRPLVVFIDDFQWANVDSAGLLNSLLRPPNAPPMLVLVTFRDELDYNETLQALTEPTEVAGREIRDMYIGSMSERESIALARSLMGDRFDESTASGYARSAQGSPFYLGQLVLGGPADAGATPGELDQLVVRRILQLDSASRRLLEVVAVAGGPVDRNVAFAASGLHQPEGLLPALREAELLVARGGEAGRHSSLETAHARIREVTVGELERDRLRETHLHLAHALERAACDPEALAEHFERGGDLLRAANYYERAAQQAATALAFKRAVNLYRTTIELLGEGGDPQRVADLRMSLAQQLINIGRGHEAAKLLLELAEWAEHPERGQLKRARECRRLAADQMIKTGHVDEGLEELDRLLRTVGMQLPKGKAAAMSAFVWEQTRLKMRGIGFTKRPAAEIEPKLLDQIDTCFAVVNGLSTQETLLMAVFHFRNLRLSLDAGEPYRVARALAYQCVVDVAGRDWRRVEEQFRIARELVSEIDDPQLAGFIDLCEASVHWFERRYTVSGGLHTKVIESLEGVSGAAWDRRTAQLHHMWTLVCQGRLREFWARAKGVEARARETGDMQEMVEVSSFMGVALVFAGKPDEARRILTAALDDWKPGRYLFGDVWAFYAQVRILLHEREPEKAIVLAKETMTQMKRTLLSEHALVRHNVQELLCRSYLCAAIERGDSRQARHARRLASKLRGAKNPTLTGLVAVIEAGLASIDGKRDQALAGWAEAADIFTAQGMRGALAAVRARQARALGETSEGRQYADHAAGYFELEDIEDIEGFLRLVAPTHERVFEADPGVSRSGRRFRR